MAWDSVHLFECPTRVHYGAGAIAGLPGAPGRARPALVVLVSDKGLLGAGTVDRVRELADAAGVAVHLYTDTAENPTTTNLDEIAALYRAQGCDGIVGLGGGSSLDAAKAASALIENGGSVWDYRGRDLVPRHGPPVICIPTTCGTGRRGHVRRRDHRPGRALQGRVRLAQPGRDGRDRRPRAGADGAARRSSRRPAPTRSRTPPSRTSTSAATRCSTRSTSARSA